MRRLLPVAVMVVAACAAAAIRPADIRLAEDPCAHCRMTIISINTAAQIVARGDEPGPFDEIGCLRDYLATHPLSPGETVFVVDHRTNEWIDGERAVFTRTSASTPMSSGLVAHADAASRDADAAARGGVPVANARVLHPGTEGDSR